LRFLLVFGWIVLLGTILVERDVDGRKYIHCITDEVLNLLRALAIFAGDYLYSQRMLLSSILRWVVLMSARVLDMSRSTFGKLRSLYCGSDRRPRAAGCELWSLITPASI
jgi:hypothetical protein